MKQLLNLLFTGINFHCFHPQLPDNSSVTGVDEKKRIVRLPLVKGVQMIQIFKSHISKSLGKETGEVSVIDPNEGHVF